MPVHPTAIVHTEAIIDPTVEIGPYAIIDGPVRIGPRTRIFPHAFLTGWTEVGADCEVHPGAVVGHLPQDFAYDGAETYCRIGDGTIIRESAQVHRGTDPGSETVVGAKCFLMASAHVGHNCRVGNAVKIASGAMLAGHVNVGDGAFLSGNATAHQFVRIGELAMVAGLARVPMDIPPFVMTDHDGRCATVNSVGMKRAGFSDEVRNEIKEAFRVLYRSGKPFRDAVAALKDRVKTDPGRRLLAFLEAPSRRGIVGSAR
jgi:UDP-N-acetylglucosamine acyltransferase